MYNDTLRDPVTWQDVLDHVGRIGGIVSESGDEALVTWNGHMYLFTVGKQSLTGTGRTTYNWYADMMLKLVVLFPKVRVGTLRREMAKNAGSAEGSPGKDAE